MVVLLPLNCDTFCIGVIINRQPGSIKHQTDILINIQSDDV